MEQEARTKMTLSAKGHNTRNGSQHEQQDGCKRVASRCEPPPHPASAIHRNKAVETIYPVLVVIWIAMCTDSRRFSAHESIERAGSSNATLVRPDGAPPLILAFPVDIRFIPLFDAVSVLPRCAFAESAAVSAWRRPSLSPALVSVACCVLVHLLPPLLLLSPFPIAIA